MTTNKSRNFHPQAMSLTDEQLEQSMTIVDNMVDNLNTELDKLSVIGWDVYSIKRELEYRGRILYREWADRKYDDSYIGYGSDGYHIGHESDILG